ncbi:MAG: hypothetical protein H0T46_00260 [Deltaproteobacteria bacterium]|nr:hypothetical protein [Deltaproteobacteria bacterium]
MSGTTVAPALVIMLTNRLAVAALAATLSLSAAACGGGGSGTVIIDDVPDSSLVVDNQSDFAIVELYLTPVNSGTWGANLLRGDVLLPDENLTLGVDCGFYDALLVDEDDVDCVLTDMDLCLNDAVWIIRNNTCTVFGAAAKERAEKAAAEAAAKAETAATK